MQQLNRDYCRVDRKKKRKIVRRFAEKSFKIWGSLTSDEVKKEFLYSKSCDAMMHVLENFQIFIKL